MANIRAELTELWAHQSRNRMVAALAVLVLVATAAALLLRPVALEAPAEPLPVVTETAAETLPEALPMRLRIPDIGVDAPFEAPLGVQENGEIEVPEAFDTVAYYQYGPTPGELGPSVVLGHVDSYQGPAVLYRLGQLEPGDQILVDREDGTVATFVVTKLERHAQSGFPTREVYGDIDHAGLRLITCSGTFDRGIQRYSHNLIVFAELVTEGNGAGVVDGEVGE